MGGAMRGSGRYGTVAILLHWLTAAAIVVQLSLAWRMRGEATPEAFAITQLHKSVGLTILVLSLARLGWRLTKPPPPMPSALKTWERRLAGLTHAAFYVILIGMPLTGWIMVSTSRLDIPTLLYGLAPWPHIPGLASLEGSARAVWNTLGFGGHLALAVGLVLLLPLHVAGALKHQLFSRNESVLARMAPGARPGRWFEPRLLAILVGLAAAAALGLLVRPPDARPAPSPAQTDSSKAGWASPAGGASNASSWTVTPGSTLEFTASWGGTPVRGRFERWRAKIAFDPQALDQSRVRVDVEVASARTGDAQRDTALSTTDWLDATAHPQAVFTADTFEQTGPEAFIAHGQLGLRGVSQSVDLPFQMQIEGDEAHVTGSAKLDRIAFGVGQGQWRTTGQVPASVEVRIDLRARRG